ncbi:MAG: class I SAM-dependent methyltransferase [Syntrophales bacterium]|nr:class I SAM-dependent methyltransferase [Syntrophales bacterium]
MLTVDFNKLDLKPGMRVLDAGCGAGRHLCEAFRTRGVQVAGVDLIWKDLEKTRSFLCLMSAEQKGEWLVAKGNVTRLPFMDGAFDVVICSEVLEHIVDNRVAVRELVRVLKPGGNLVVSVPRFMPERICWALSSAYHEEPGGHIRIYRKNELYRLLKEAGTRCWNIRYKHALHSPYWWLRCLVGHKNERFPLVKLYKRFLEWDIVCHPPLTRLLDKLLNPLLAKSIVYYMRKGS